VHELLEKHHCLDFVARGEPEEESKGWRFMHCAVLASTRNRGGTGNGDASGGELGGRELRKRPRKRPTWYLY
jgi:hypothetical protein